MTYKILVFDIESLHNKIAAFDFYNPNPYTNMLEERRIISIAWKWLGSRQIESISVLDNPKKMGLNTDKYILQQFLEVLKQADAVVAHYGDKFDIPFINSRLAYHRMEPFPLLKQIDTKKIASKYFRFNSNRLDYLAEYFGVGRKRETKPRLWLRCLAGEIAAIQEMVKYNRKDITLLEKVYNILRPFAPAALNAGMLKGRDVCSSCGKKDIQYRGYVYTKTYKYRRYQCSSCKHWGQAVKAEKVDITTK